MLAHIAVYIIAVTWFLDAVTGLFFLMILIKIVCFAMRVSLYFIVGACLTLIDMMRLFVHILAALVFISMVILGCACTYLLDTLSAVGCEAFRLSETVINLMKGVRVGENEEEGGDFKDVEIVVGVTAAGEEETVVSVNHEEVEAVEVAADGEGPAGMVAEDDEEQKTRSRTASILSFWDGLKKRLSISGYAAVF